MNSENTNYIIYLVELAQRGRQNAYIDLCEINLRSVYLICTRLLANEKTAREISTRVFINAWDTMKEFDLNQSFALWIKEIAVKESLIDLNKDNEEHNQKAGPKGFFTKEIEFTIAQLDKEQRAIFVLHDIEGYTYEEICEFMPDLSNDEIKSILIETRKLLMDKLSV